MVSASETRADIPPAPPLGGSNMQPITETERAHVNMYHVATRASGGRARGSV